MNLFRVSSFEFEQYLTRDATSIQEPPWTILRLLNWSKQFLDDQGVPEPRLSSELLLGSVLNLDRLGLFLHYDQPLSPPELKAFKGLLVRRARHEPMAYLLGQKEFWSLPFLVDRSVLIPRPETELLVEESLALVQADPDLKNLVELGAGSGAVIISLVKTLMKMSGEKGMMAAVERSAASLKTAAANARRHGVAAGLSFIRGNWLTPFQSKRPWIHLLAVNPPYLSAEDLKGLDRGIRDYEPLEALDGGLDGLDAVRVILEQAREQIVPGGWLLMEIGETQGGRVSDLARKQGFSPVHIRPDYAGKDRLLKARKP